ncbi:MAG: HYR domain-containing protein [candidate division Zixibacteria bacterium]|nr:HYR domain-containing protein [candidate division Zixibacteria bacterium]
MQRCAVLTVMTLGCVCLAVSSYAANTVVIPSQTVYTNQTDVVISVHLTNDISPLSVVVPLVVREIDPGSYITAAEMSYGDRLPEVGGPLNEVIIKNQYPVEDGDCKSDNPGGFGEPGSADFVSPDGFLYFRGQLFNGPLPPGADATGSIILTVDVTGVEGSFEIDTTCVNADNHLFYTEGAGGTVPEFTKGIVTIINRPPVALCQDLQWVADENCEAAVSVNDVDAGSFDDDGTVVGRRLEPEGPYPPGDHVVLLIIEDDDGDVDTCQSVISVEDATPPQITCPSDTVVGYANDACGATVTYDVIASDNCGVASLVSQPPSGSFFPTGVTTVECIATDDAGLADTCEFTVTVADTNSPWTVCNLNDSGYGSLRSAIDSANGSSGADVIDFAVAGEIELASALPDLSDATGGTLIDGFTAPGASESPHAATITIDGAFLSTGAGFQITSSDNVVRGMRIINFPYDGIAVVGASAQFNTLSANIIHSNGELAIDLGDDHLTPNDPGDGDTGPNDLLNFPWPDSVFYVGQDSFYVAGATEIPGSRVELFLSDVYLGGDTLGDTSGHGEAWMYLGSSISDVSTGHFVFPTLEVSEWSRICASVIDPAGNTSELSANRIIIPDSLIIRAYALSALLFVVAPNGEDSIGIDFASKQTYNTFGNVARYDSLTDHGLGPDSTGSWPDEEIVITNLMPGDYEVRVGNDGEDEGNYFMGIRVNGYEENYVGQPGVTSSEPISNDLPPQGDAVIYTYEPDEQLPCNCPWQADHDESGFVDAVDLNLEINVLFFNSPEIFDPGCPAARSDFNDDSFSDAVDLNLLIRYMFFNGSDPCDPCQPEQDSCNP